MTLVLRTAFQSRRCRYGWMGWWGLRISWLWYCLAWRWYQNNKTLVRLKYIALFISYLNSMKPYYRTIALYRCNLWWCDYGILQLSTPCLKTFKGAIHQWLWKAVTYTYTVWEEEMPVWWSSGILDKESYYVTCCYGWCSMQLKRWVCYEVIYYYVHHYSCTCCPSLGW